MSLSLLSNIKMYVGCLGELFDHPTLQFLYSENGHMNSACLIGPL